MGSEWVRPVNVTLGNGGYGLGTVQGGMFNDNERYDVSYAWGPRTPFFVPMPGTGHYEWINGQWQEGYWTASWHGGIDIAALFGSQLLGIGGGLAETGYETLGYGHYIRVRRPDGYAYLYAHLREEPTVETGDTVVAGQLLGFVGMSGKATGPHLHLELELGGNFDPLPFLLAASDIGEVPEPVIPLAPNLSMLGYKGWNAVEQRFVYEYEVYQHWDDPANVGPNIANEYIGYNAETGQHRFRLGVLKHW